MVVVVDIGDYAGNVDSDIVDKERERPCGGIWPVSFFEQCNVATGVL